MQVQFQVVQFWDVLCYEFPKQTKIQLKVKNQHRHTDDDGRMEVFEQGRWHRFAGDNDVAAVAKLS